MKDGAAAEWAGLGFPRRVDGRSGPVFFADPETEVPCVGYAHFQAMRRESVGGRNVRLCLHSGPEARHHDMIVLEWPDAAFPPHRHRDKAESLHLIDGRLRIVLFDELGQIERSRDLDRESPIVRIPRNRFHCNLAIGEGPALYRETKPGPFDADTDAEKAPFAPDRRDADAFADYLRRLRDL